MTMTNFRRFALLVLLCGLVFNDSSRLRVAAQKAFQVTDVVLQAGDANASGKCPVKVVFNGYITTNGPGTVKYTFTRNDGATAPIQTLNFTKAGTQTVSTDWTLGDASVLPRYEGWQAIKILSPNEMESSHEKGSFVMKCADVPSNTPSVTWPGSRNINQGRSKNMLPQVLKERATISKPDFIKLIPERNFAGIFIIKFVEGSHIRYRDGIFKTSKDQLNNEEIRRLGRLKLSVEKVLEEVEKINQLSLTYFKKYSFFPISTFPYPGRREDPNGQFREKERLELVSGEELADLDLYFTFVATAKGFKDLEAQQEYMNALNKSAIIEDVHAAVLTENAEVKSDSHLALFNKNFSPLDTPDFSSQQRYLDAAPVGIDARYAWDILGGRGLGIKVIDVEYDWQTNHEDFASAGNLFWGGRAPGICSTVGPDTNHGTAVMGVLNGRHNRLGVSGITPDVRYGLASVCRAEYIPGFFFSLFTGENVIGRTHNIAVAAAINDAARALGRGDVLLIEQHTYGPQGEWVPMEYYQESFDAIRRAAIDGQGPRSVVVEAAGNGGMNLDDARYGARFNPTVRHSGALLVGASNGNGDTNRAPFSNFGARVDVHGWGGGVVTLGYGVDAENNPVSPWNLGDVTRYYTQGFGGTSSASPIVAGAVASIQGARRARFLEPLNGSLLKMLFASTGTPQGSASAAENIGPLPNLRGAIDATLGGTSRGGFTGPGTYFIQARHSNKVLDINFAFFTGQLDGRPLAQFDNYNGDNQKFIIESLGGGFVSIKAKHSGKCLDVANFSRGPAGLQQWRCTGGESQQFVIEPVGDFYKIRVKHSGLYFDVSGGSMENGARLIQYAPGGGDNQLFQFIPTH